MSKPAGETRKSMRKALEPLPRKDPSKLDLIYAEIERNSDIFVEKVINRIENFLNEKHNWKVQSAGVLTSRCLIGRLERERFSEPHMREKFYKKLKELLESIGGEVVFPKKIFGKIYFYNEEYHDSDKLLGCVFKYTVKY